MAMDFGIDSKPWIQIRYLEYGSQKPDRSRLDPDLILGSGPRFVEPFWNKNLFVDCSNLIF